MDSTGDVLDRHLDAFARFDLQTIVDTYADDAFIVTVDEVIRGREEIRAEFDRLFREFSDVQIEDVDLQEVIVEGDYGVIVWNAETPETNYEYVTATFHIPDDRIVAQSMTGRIIDKG